MAITLYYRNKACMIMSSGPLFSILSLLVILISADTLTGTRLISQDNAALVFGGGGFFSLIWMAIGQNLFSPERNFLWIDLSNHFSRTQTEIVSTICCALLSFTPVLFTFYVSGSAEAGLFFLFPGSLLLYATLGFLLIIFTGGKIKIFNDRRR